MTKHRRDFTSIALAIVTFALLAILASASQTAELRCSEIIKPLSAGNYAADTVHFDPTIDRIHRAERSDHLNTWSVNIPDDSFHIRRWIAALLLFCHLCEAQR
jgi:hypothetical protein